jgi:hypothetical protein
MSFSIVLGLIGSFILVGLIGVLIAFVFLRSSIRNLLRNNMAVRILLLTIISLLLFVFTFAVSTHILANNMYGVVSASFDAIQTKIQEDPVLVQQLDDWKNNEPAIIKEIWLQQMMIPRETYRCFGGDTKVCSLMQVVGISGSSTWKTFPIFFGLGLFSAAAFVFFSNWMLKYYLKADTNAEEKFPARPRSKARQI